MSNHQANEVLKPANNGATLVADEQPTSLEDDLMALERRLIGTLYLIWRLTGQQKRIVKT